VREPPPALGLVDAERLEPLVQVAGQPAGTSTFVVEREHPDAPRLAVPMQRKKRLPGRLRGAAQGSQDPVQLLFRPVSEERERRVQVLSRNEARAGHPRELVVLPVHEPVEELIREPQGEKET
jgi:hypothetical protein